MKVLVIPAQPVYPPDTGGKQVVYATTKGLAERGHDVTMMSVTEGPESLPGLESFCRWIPGEARPENSFRDAIINLPSRTPYPVRKYSHTGVRERLSELLSTESFDVVHVEGLHAAQYGQFAAEEFDIATVLRSHNVETDVMRDVYKTTENPLKKTFAYIQTRKLARYEPKVLAQFDRCLMITEQDCSRMNELGTGIDASIIPAAVDTDQFAPMEVEQDHPSVVFLGSMGWPPNADAIKWFYEEVFPQVRREVPEVTLYVVGKNPPEELQQLDDDNLVVTGFVEDVRPHVARGSVFIAPIRMGSGVRIKVLNAMAMGMPIVSTPLGAQGIETQDSTHLRIADTAERFSTATVELLEAPNQQVILGKQARELIEQRYRVDKIAEQVERIYKNILK